MNSIINRGVMILGLPRSGTTLLRRLLNAHSNIVCPPESNLFNSCARFLQADHFANSFPVGPLNSLSFLDFPEEVVLSRLKEFAFGFLEEYASRRDKRIWVEKSPKDAFYIEEIERIVGDDVRFICVYRHALDVGVSTHELCEKTGGYLSEIHAYICRYLQPLEAYAQMWVEKTSGFIELQKRRPQQVVGVRYEDLVTSPETELQRILAFMGEEWQPGMLEMAMGSREELGLGDWKTYAKSKIDSDSIGKWRQLPSPTIHYLARIVNPVLIQCGYDPIVSNDESDEADGRRRYELGLMLQQLKSSSSVSS